MAQQRDFGHRAAEVDTPRKRFVRLVHLVRQVVRLGVKPAHLPVPQLAALHQRPRNLFVVRHAHHAVAMLPLPPPLPPILRRHRLLLLRRRFRWQLRQRRMLLTPRRAQRIEMCGAHMVKRQCRRDSPLRMVLPHLGRSELSAARLALPPQRVEVCAINVVQRHRRRDAPSAVVF